jgi:membrane protein insertase Oxa1/YidC/SpoIIIJ
MLFLWVRDLSRPDVVVGVLATLLTVAATASGSAGPAPNRAIILLRSAVPTAVALSNMAAGVGLYWGLSSLIGAVQGLVIQRRARAAA